MAYRIETRTDDNGEFFMVVSDAGNPVRSTNEGKAFTTRDRQFADEVLALCNAPQPLAAMSKSERRAFSHRAKSAIGA